MKVFVCLLFIFLEDITRTNGGNVRKRGGNSSPLTLLAVDRLNGHQVQCLLVPVCFKFQYMQVTKAINYDKFCLKSTVFPPQQITLEEHKQQVQQKYGGFDIPYAARIWC